jgi:hypothetical protein
VWCGGNAAVVLESSRKARAPPRGWKRSGVPGGVCGPYAAGTPEHPESQIARRTAAASAMSAAPTSTIAVSSRSPVSETATRCTATGAAARSRGSPPDDGAAPTSAAFISSTRDAFESSRVIRAELCFKRCATLTSHRRLVKRFDSPGYVLTTLDTSKRLPNVGRALARECRMRYES